MSSKYRDHIESLAKNLNCEVRYSKYCYAMMYCEFNYVIVPELNTQIDYLAALHELGHQNGGIDPKDGMRKSHTQGRPPHGDKTFYFDNGILRSEHQAWTYALDNCLEFIDNKPIDIIIDYYGDGIYTTKKTYTPRQFMWDHCLGSYYTHYLQLGGTKTRLGNGDRGYILTSYDHPDDEFVFVMNRIRGDEQTFQIQYVGRYDA
jgi:hypothetical protein